MIHRLWGALYPWLLFLAWVAVLAIVVLVSMRARGL